MNNLSAEVTTEPLLFNWDSPRRRQTAILAFLTISLFAHAVCFYIFQVVYPPTVTLLPPPARVSLITPASEEGRTLLRWIDAEDPAVAFTTHRPLEARLRALPKVEHVPSYNLMEPTLKEPAPFKIDSRAPESQPPDAVPLPRQKSSFTAAPIATSVSFSNEFDSLGTATLPAPKFIASNKETPEAIRFRVAVNKRGELRYCFPMNSSGDPGLDVQARLYLTRCRFAQHAHGSVNDDASLAWGIATIEWGNDVVRPEGTQQPRAQP